MSKLARDSTAVFAPFCNSRAAICSPVVLSSDGRSGRPPRGSVFISMATYNGVLPAFDGHPTPPIANQAALIDPGAVGEISSRTISG